jgi:hypothetical protein
MDTTTTNKPFAVGDLVRVTEGTDDPRLPENRTGLIVASEPAGLADVYRVQFGTSILRFHALFLERVS